MTYWLHQCLITRSIFLSFRSLLDTIPFTFEILTSIIMSYSVIHNIHPTSVTKMTAFCLSWSSLFPASRRRHNKCRCGQHSTRFLLQNFRYRLNLCRFNYVFTAPSLQKSQRSVFPSVHYFLPREKKLQWKIRNGQCLFCTIFFHTYYWILPYFISPFLGTFSASQRPLSIGVLPFIQIISCLRKETKTVNELVRGRRV